MSDERGSMLPAFGGLLFVSFVILSLAVEIGRLGVAYRATASAADIAAEAGAAMVDVALLHDGTTQLDRLHAGTVARETLSRLGIAASQARIVVQPSEVCVAISRTHDVFALGYLAITSVQVDVTGCAEPATG